MNNHHFLHNHRNGCKKWHFKNSKSNVKLFGNFPNHDKLIFLNLQQSKFVPRHVELYRFGFLKIERERTFTAGKNRSYPGNNRSEKVELLFHFWGGVIITARRKNKSNTPKIHVFSIFFIDFLIRNGSASKKWHFLHSKSIVKLIGKTSNQMVVIFLNLPQS